MKKWGIFLGGVATGIILTIVIALIINNVGINDNPIGVIDFDKPGEVIDESYVEVLQVITNTSALVIGSGWHEKCYLLRNHEGKYYYDNEKIQLPKETVFRQMGIYKYTSKAGDSRTVPIIEIVHE